MIIEGGGNVPHKAAVNDEGELLVHATTEPIADDRATHGNSYNFNTGAPFDIGSNNSSAVVFFKNSDATYNLVITAFIYNLGVPKNAVTDGSEFMNIVIVRNPDSISSGTDRDPINRNHGSSNTLSGTFQVGAGGNTFTGGTDMIESLLTAASRNFIGVGAVILTPNNTLGIRFEAHTSTTQQYIQFAVAMYLDKSS